MGRSRAPPLQGNGMNTNHRNRKPTRLRGFDYSQKRAYFVTVCTQDRCQVLAEICRGGALLLPIGEIVNREIHDLSQRFDVSVDQFVIMPNHIHMILVLHGKGEADALTDILCAFKSITTKEANRLEHRTGRKIWQRSSYDHIIRDEKDYLKIWQYIDENPRKWELDCFYRDMDREENNNKASEQKEEYHVYCR